MKKVTIAAVQVPIGRIEVKIRDPGIVRHVAFEHKPKLVMHAGQPNFEEVPVIFVEGEHEAPVRAHRFVIIRHGEWCEVEDGEQAKHVASGVSGAGLVVHVFEVTELE